MNKKYEEVKRMMEERVPGLNQLLEKAQAGFQIEHHDFFRDNQPCNGYYFKDESHNITPILYYDSDWWNKTDPELVAFLMEYMKTFADNINISSYFSRQMFLEHVVPRLISAERIPFLEKQGLVYERFLDMAVIYCIEFTNESTESTSVIKLTESLRAHFELDLPLLKERALQNIDSRVTIRSMEEVLQILMQGYEPQLQSPTLYVVSVDDNNYGAAALLCPDTLTKLSSLLGDQFAILPSSVHEVIATPMADPEEMYETVKHVNLTNVPADQVLSDNVYLYDHGTLHAYR